MFNRLQTRLTLIFILLAVLPLLVVSTIISSRSSATLERTALRSLNEVAQRVASETSAFIDARVSELQLSANLNDLRSADERSELEILLFRTNVYEEISVVGLDGQTIAHFTRSIDARQSQSYTDDQTVRAAIQGDELAFGDVYFDDAVREPLMRVAFPVLDVQSGEPVLVLTALFSFRPVWDLVRDGGDGIEAFLLAPNREVIAHRDPAHVLSQQVVDLPAEQGRLNLAEGAVLFAQAPVQLGEQTLTAVTQQPVALALALEQENQRIVTLLTIGALVLAIALVVLVVNQVVRPIARLAVVAQRIRSGDLEARAEQGGHDEVGQLSASFNAMAGQLAGMVGSLEQQVNERTLALADALKEVEERAARQAELLEQVARQREDILALSVPIMPVDRGTLVLPLVGAFDSERLVQVQERALDAIQQAAARRLIIDVTGTPLIDTQVARGLLSLLGAARLLGTEVQLVGIRPEVAQTIVGLGLDFSSVRIFSTLESALSTRLTTPQRPAIALPPSGT